MEDGRHGGSEERKIFNVEKSVKEKREGRRWKGLRQRGKFRGC